ncbi:TPA: hypothetical protein N0F65_004700 [Lagenidium giganteum]|uniref:Uncharacterized protein n=1 Tax=Lagenidium giganteum TaxID=4803 RepID=A0AAV2Z4R8_9STRA|nr:TPA: hypothetical protein N0F65_004700 [Lagenidium giganteum]
MGPINAVSEQFLNADIIGGLFHWKQALRRKIKQLCISEPQAQIAMTREVLDMLTVIEQGKIQHQGIAWAYFRLVWLKRIQPKFWNVYPVDRELVARTKNAFERFNRELSSSFPSPHPGIPVFVTTICAISKKHAAKLESIRKGKSRLKTREKIVLPKEVTLDWDEDAIGSDTEDCEGIETKLVKELGKSEAPSESGAVHVEKSRRHPADPGRGKRCCILHGDGDRLIFHFFDAKADDEDGNDHALADSEPQSFEDIADDENYAEKSADPIDMDAQYETEPEAA